MKMDKHYINSCRNGNNIFINFTIITQSTEQKKKKKAAAARELIRSVKK